MKLHRLNEKTIGPSLVCKHQDVQLEIENDRFLPFVDLEKRTLISAPTSSSKDSLYGSSMKRFLFDLKDKEEWHGGEKTQSVAPEK